MDRSNCESWFVKEALLLKENLTVSVLMKMHGLPLTKKYN